VLCFLLLCSASIPRLRMPADFSNPPARCLARRESAPCQRAATFAPISARASERADSSSSSFAEQVQVGSPAATTRTFSDVLMARLEPRGLPKLVKTPPQLINASGKFISPRQRLGSRRNIESAHRTVPRFYSIHQAARRESPRSHCNVSGPSAQFRIETGYSHCLRDSPR